jgi:hypothetical protein
MAVQHLHILGAKVVPLIRSKSRKDLHTTEAERVASNDQNQSGGNNFLSSDASNPASCDCGAAIGRSQPHQWLAEFPEWAVRGSSHRERYRRSRALYLSCVRVRNEPKLCHAVAATYEGRPYLGLTSQLAT